MAGSSPMMQALLVAPGVKGRTVLAFKLKEKDALMRSIIAGGGVRRAFYVLDLGRVVDLYGRWRRAHPGVRPFYVPRPRPLAAQVHGEKTYASTVFGPTCDSYDTVLTGYQLPEMSVGAWLVFDDMGAYTTALACNFNGFSTSDINTFLAYSS